MLKQKTVYFREEDLPLWNNVSNKAQWLHDGLTTALVSIPPRDIPDLKNVKVNDDGTPSPIDPSRPTRIVS